MTTIDSVEARTIVVPLDAVTSFARRVVKERHYTVVRVRAGEAEGIGFCYAGSAGGGIVTEVVRDLIAPALVDRDPRQMKGFWEELYQELILHGRAGSAMRALSIVDVALWDLSAKLVSLPLWQYLGAVVDAAVPAYASGGYYLDGKTPNDLGEEMRSYAELGFRAVKIKVGRETPAGDEARVAAAREAVGPDVLLMLDANNAWRDLPTALSYVRRFEDYDPYWIEEPFLPDDIENHARLARKTPISVATGEIEVGRWNHRRLLAAEGASILQTDAAVCGGISEFQRIAATADSYGVTVSPHWFHDLHVHLVASTPNARFVEFFPDDKVLNFRRLIDRQLAVTADGLLQLPVTPGLGFEFDQGALDRFAVGPWA